ncbi:hypothetical protein THAOC_36976, partial [Thalassiosira oceanica]
ASSLPSSFQQPPAAPSAAHASRAEQHAASAGSGRAAGGTTETRQTGQKIFARSVACADRVPKAVADKQGPSLADEFVGDIETFGPILLIRQAGASGKSRRQGGAEGFGGFGFGPPPSTNHLSRGGVPFCKGQLR